MGPIDFPARGCKNLPCRNGVSGACSGTGRPGRILAFALLLILPFLALSGAAGARELPEPAGEVRGLWVVRDSLTGPESIDQFLRMAEELGLNALFVQVNGRAEAYYRSALVPSPLDLPPDFDPLAYVIAGARSRGIEVHAWVNAFTVGMLSARPVSPRHVLHQHPDWVLYHRSGRSLLDFGPGVTALNVPAIMLEPGLPEVQDYVVAVVEELVREYDIDGIHLDYLRYPSPDYGYHPRVRGMFQDLVGIDPIWLGDDDHRERLREAWGGAVVDRVEEAWREWRRRQVTSILRRVYQTVETVKPWVKVSVAVFPDPFEARRAVLQDWPSWLREGIVDAVVPMAYTPDAAVVSSQLRRAADLAEHRHVYGGLGIYRLGGQPDLLRSILAGARDAGIQGVVLFSYNHLRGDRHMVDFLKGELPAGPPPVPAMPWKGMRPEGSAARL